MEVTQRPTCGNCKDVKLLATTNGHQAGFMGSEYNTRPYLIHQRFKDALDALPDQAAGFTASSAKNNQTEATLPQGSFGLLPHQFDTNRVISGRQTFQNETFITVRKGTGLPSTTYGANTHSLKLSA